MAKGAGGEAPGREEEARVGGTGRLRVAGRGWMTCWVWDGAWVTEQRTTESKNNGIAIQRA